MTRSTVIRSILLSLVIWITLPTLYKSFGADAIRWITTVSIIVVVSVESALRLASSSES